MKDRTSKGFYKEGSKVSQFTRFLQNYQRMRESSAVCLSLNLFRKQTILSNKRSPFNKHHILIDIGSKNSKNPKTKPFFPKSQKSQKSKEIHHTYSNILQKSKYKNLHRVNWPSKPSEIPIFQPFQPPDLVRHLPSNRQQQHLA